VKQRRRQKLILTSLEQRILALVAARNLLNVAFDETIALVELLLCHVGNDVDREILYELHEVALDLLD
jgi:hypothetical protein